MLLHLFNIQLSSETISVLNASDFYSYAQYDETVSGA